MLITISSNKNIVKIATQDGVDDFVVKPFEIDELLKKVEREIKS